MQSKTEMQQGWEFAIGIMGADIAAHMGQEYEILSGLEEGATVVVKGQALLRDGVKVNVL